MGGAISKKSIKHTTPISHYLKNPTEQENLNALKEFAMIQLLEPLKKKNDSKNIFEFFNSDTDPQKKRSNSEARYMKFAPFEVGQDETMRKICSPHRLPKINPTKKTTNKVIYLLLFF